MKVPVKIVSIEEMTIDIFFENIIERKELKPYFANILKEKGLLYDGAEFQFEYLQIEDGLQIKVISEKAEPRESKYYKELIDLWNKQLEREL